VVRLGAVFLARSSRSRYDVIKWLWYGNAALAGAAVLVLVLGLWGLAGLDGTDGLAAGRSGGGASEEGLGAGGEGQDDSPLVGTIRHYSERWVPKPPKGSVRVTVAPAELAGEVRWRLDGGEWQASETLLEGVLAGSHKVEYEEADGWLSPTAMTVKVAKAQTLEVRGVYRVPPPPPGKGSLRVTLGPAEAVAGGAEWRLDGGEWQQSEATLEAVVEGSHRLEYKGVEGWQTPGVGTVKVVKDETLEVSQLYSPPPPPPAMGGLQVVLRPRAVVESGGQWRVDGGPWQSSRAEVGEVLTGSHQVEFKPVAGWLTPDPCSVEVGAGVTSVLERRYAKSPPPAPRFKLTGTMAVVGSDRGVAWFRLADQKSEPAYFLGERVQGYRLAAISDGRVTLTRDGYDFELQVVVKEAPKEAPKPPVTAARPGGRSIPRPKTSGTVRPGTRAGGRGSSRTPTRR